MERITITIDDALLATVDALVEKRGYPSRSEAIRELLREAAKQDHAAEGSAPCVASLTYVYDHSVRDLPQRIVTAQRGVRHANLHLIPAKPSGHSHAHAPGEPGHDHEAP
jgi:nickel-responsive transcriptional regulator NikR